MEENGFGRSLASSAGSNDHSTRIEIIMPNTPNAPQAVVLSEGKVRMRAPAKKKHSAMYDRSVQMSVVQRPVRNAVFAVRKGASASKKRPTMGEKGLSFPVRALC